MSLNCVKGPVTLKATTGTTYLPDIYLHIYSSPTVDHSGINLSKVTKRQLLTEQHILNKHYNESMQF